MRTVYLDGQYLKLDAPVIEALTPGNFRAKGVFETMMGLDGMMLDAALHLARLKSGLKVLGIKPPAIDPSILIEVLGRNRLSAGRVRLMVWQAGEQVHVMIGAFPYKVPEKPIYRVTLVKTERAANARSANVKSLDYGLFAVCYAWACSKGFDEALLINRRGHIFEASRSNIFWVKDKVLFTPPLTSGCLNGITRQQVIRHAKILGISVKEKNLSPGILKEADSAFLTNSLIGIKAIEIKEIKIA